MHQRKFVVLSGGFDPLHVGHLDYIHAASDLGSVAILLNSDEWLIRKKGYRFMPYADRKGILSAIKHVDAVWRADDADDTVRESIIYYQDKIAMFAKGGDRTRDNTPELSLCRELGIPVKFGIGLGKVRSSSEFVKNVPAR